MSARTRDLPRRSCLSVPGSSEKMLGKAPTLPADMVFLDLEDSVAPLEKEAARDKVVRRELRVSEGELYNATGLNVSRERLKRTGYFKDEGRVDLYTADGDGRVGNFSTYIRTLTEEEAVAEARRCLNCGCGEGCGLCASICSEFAIHLASPDVWEIDSEECVACGMCYNRCPNKNIEMIDKHIKVK